MEQHDKNTPKFAPKPVKFIHQKCSGYRIFHADNAWGGVNGAGNLKIDFCVEHPISPTAVVAPVKPDGSFTGEQLFEGIDDPQHYLVVREFQCGIVLSFAAAIQVRSVLDNYINATRQQANTLIEEIKKPENK